jgi:hypothetical protein
MLHIALLRKKSFLILVVDTLLLISLVFQVFFEFYQGFLQLSQHDAAILTGILREEVRDTIEEVLLKRLGSKKLNRKWITRRAAFLSLSSR